MLHAKSDSDVTSLAPSSPRSPKRPVYYVQSPSRDSHDGDKSSSMQTTPIYNSPTESPSHPSFGRHSRASSASRFSGTFWSSSGRKGSRKRNEKGWRECNVIEEEGSYDDLDEDREFSRPCQVFLALLGFVLLFTVFSLIIWGASRHYKAEVIVKSLTVNNLYLGSGVDNTGVPTKMVTMNCSLKISVYNPATLFGIHVSSSPINLMYSKISMANGQVLDIETCQREHGPKKLAFVSLFRQLKKYFQPRKSNRVVSVILQGNKLPLYGAGASLAVSETGSGKVPLTLEFEIRSRGNVIGKLVRTKHHRHVSCPVVVDSTNTKPIKFSHDSCTYD